MKINASDPIWSKLVLGEISVPLKYLASKIALSHLQLQVRFGRYSVEKAAYELYMIYYKGENIPAVKEDLETLQLQKQ